MAQPLHDIGKVGTPNTILRRPGRLTAEEFEIIRTHAAIGRTPSSPPRPGRTIPSACRSIAERFADSQATVQAKAGAGTAGA